MTISTSASLYSLQVTVSNFKNPNSNSPISGISAILVSSTSITKASYNSATLSNLTPDVLSAAAIAAMSTTIGATGVMVQISLTPKNYLRATGSIEVFFPLWNPSDSFPSHQI